MRLRLKGKTRLMIVGLVLALGGAVWVAWPILSVERVAFRSVHQSTFRHARSIPRLPHGLIGGGPPPHWVLGYEVRGRWDLELHSRTLWSDDGWRVLELHRVDDSTAIGKFWSRGWPRAVYRYEIPRDYEPYTPAPWPAEKLPKTSPHFPTRLEERDAPWIRDEISYEEWWNRVRP